MASYIEITEPNPKRHTHNCRIRIPKNASSSHLASMLREVELAAWNAYSVGERVEVSLVDYAGILIALRKIYPHCE